MSDYEYVQLKYQSALEAFGEHNRECAAFAKTLIDSLSAHGWPKDHVVRRQVEPEAGERSAPDGAAISRDGWYRTEVMLGVSTFEGGHTHKSVFSIRLRQKEDGSFAVRHGGDSRELVMRPGGDLAPFGASIAAAVEAHIVREHPRGEVT